MPRPVFLADHDLNEHIVDGLLRREPSLAISRARDHGLERTADARLLAFAAEAYGHVVISHDVNTMPAAAFALLDAGEVLGGLIMVRQTLPVARVIDDLLLIWSATDSAEWTNRIVFLSI
jgi:hypothetical protein